MGSALGFSPAMSAVRDHGSGRADIRDFGAVSYPTGTPPTAAVQATRAAFQAAIDSFKSSPNGGVVYVPGGKWFLDRPVFCDLSNVAIVGEGPSASLVYATTAHDMFVYGVARQPQGVALTADHFVDLFTGGPGGASYLDSSAVNGSGQRWALRTKGNCHIAQQGGAFDTVMGTYYKGLQVLTVEFAIDLTNNPGAANGSNQYSGFGLNDGPTPMPWLLDIARGRFQVMFSTSDKVFRLFQFYTVPSTPGFVRGAFQIDLANAQVAAWINGVQVATTNSLGSGFTASAGLTFLPNQMSPFGIGSNAFEASVVTDYYGGPSDLTFCGLKVSSALLYTAAGVGTAKTRIDSKTVNDNLRYFTVETSTIGLLPLTDDPAISTIDRVLSIQGYYPYPSTGYFLDNAGHGSPWAGINAGPISGLFVRCANAYFGRSIVTGWTGSLNVRGCTLWGGSHAIGTLNFGANYPIVISDCSLYGSDAGISLFYSSSVTIRNIQFLSPSYRAVIRLYESHLVRVEGLFVAGYCAPDYIVWANKSDLDLDRANFDFEGSDQGPTIAMIYASSDSFRTMSSTLRLSNIECGIIQDSAVVIMLDDLGVEDGWGSTPSTFSMRDVYIEGQVFRSWVQTNGTRWRAEFEAENARLRPRWVENTAGVGSVVARHPYYLGPPRDGTWDRNANILRPKNPTDGQFTEWRCLATGSYGTPTPPSWFGLSPIDTNGTALAAYVSDNAYWASSGAPVGAQGAFSNSVHSMGLNALFGGSATTLPSPLSMALNAYKATRSTYLGEMSGGGYARVPVPTTSWGASSGGTMINVQAISFPQASGPWTFGTFTRCQSLCLLDPSSHPIAAVDIAPLTVTSGMAPSFPVGSITIAPAVASTQGGFATIVHDMLNNAWLRGTLLAPPAVYLALSTSAATTASAPVEPFGGSYARVATSPASWTSALPGNLTNSYGPVGNTAVVTNAVSLSFPAPTGSWGTVQSVYLMDSSSGGNVLAAANLTIPRTVKAGGPANAFAPGALWICRS